MKSAQKLWTSKERVRAALRHEEPDCVPVGETGIDAHITERILGRRTHYRGGWWSQIASWEGRAAEVMESHKRDMVELYTKLDYDVVPVFLGADVSMARAVEVKRIDDETVEVSGVRYVLSSQTNKYVAVKSSYPAQDFTQWKEGPPYQSPSDAQWELFDHCVSHLGDRFLLARDLGGFFHGDEAFLMACYDHPGIIARMNAYACEHDCRRAQDFIRHGADAVFIGGDYCDSRSPMISPAKFRELIFPWLKELCAAIHKAGGYAVKHTDGHTWPLLDMFAEAGVDILHAIQPSAGMDIKKMKKRYGKTFTFLGAIDCDTLVRGTPEQIRNEVDYNLRWASPGGGHILCSGNTIQYGVPFENFMAMLGRLREKGSYPIDFQGLHPQSVYEQARAS